MLKRTIGLFSIIQMFAGGVTVAELRYVLSTLQRVFKPRLRMFNPCPIIEEEVQDDNYVRLCGEFADFAKNYTTEVSRDQKEKILEFSDFLSGLENVDQLPEQKEKLKDLIFNAKESLKRLFLGEINPGFKSIDQEKDFYLQAKADAEKEVNKAYCLDRLPGYDRDKVWVCNLQLALIEGLEKIERW